MIRNRIFGPLLFALLFTGLSPAFASITEAPRSVSVSSTSSAGTAINEASARVSWSHDGLNVIGFVVRYRIGSETATTIVLESASPRDVQITNLRGGQTYNITVSAISSSNGLETVSDLVTHVARSVPPAPSVVSSEAGNGQVTLKWSAAAANTETGGLELTNYVLESDQGNVETVSATLTEKIVTGLSPGSTHNFTIRALNSLGRSIAAPFTKAVVFDRPGAPTDVTLSADSRKLTTTWSEPSSGGSAITGYTAFLTSGGNDIDSKTTEATTRSAEFTEVSDGSYQVQVIATNAVGNSNRSVASREQVVNVSASLRRNFLSVTPNKTTLKVDDVQLYRFTATSGDTAVVAIVSSNPNGACEISNVNNEVKALKFGTCSMRATVEANTEYSAVETTIVLTITGLTQTINFDAISNQSAPGTLSLTASATSGLSISYAVSGDCSISATTLTTRAGVCEVTASQPGDLRYYAAVPTTRRFTIQNSGGFGGFPGLSLPPQIGDSSTVESTVTLTLQVAEIGSQGLNLPFESCVEVRPVSGTGISASKKCASSATTVEFVLKNGDYRLVVTDPTFARTSQEYVVSVRDGVIGLGALRATGSPPRYVLLIGPPTKPAVVDTTGVISSETSTPLGGGKESTTATSDSKTATTTGNKEDSRDKKPVVKVVARVTSTLPPINNSFLQTRSTATKVKRAQLTISTQALAISRKDPLQLSIPIKGKSTTVSIKVKPQGKPAFTLLKERRVVKGSFNSPLMQFKKTGSYTLNITIGDKESILKLTIKK